MNLRRIISRSPKFFQSRYFAFKKLDIKNSASPLYKLQVIPNGQHLYGIYNKDAVDYELDLNKAADHLGRQQNHIWSKEEIDSHLHSIYRHKPVTLTDKAMNTLMYSMYHSFNYITGYTHGNTSVKSMEWRLIVLESVAGVPGFVAAGFRHFKSLRNLERDHGWIATLLEEAENERMHLLVCLKMFKASFLTRSLVVSAQLLMTPFLMTLYAVHPSAVHRFVGYLEETACTTYASVIHQVQTPGTPLHEGWSNLPAPNIAKSYWKLPEDAKFVDTLKCMFADECHHRDVNHTFAELNNDEPSPFCMEHRNNSLKAWEMETKGLTAWPANSNIKKEEEKVDHK
jgi:hypothetical protein